MVLVSLDENEIREIRKTLENILLKDMTKKDQLVHLFSKWFRNKGVSPESSQKILSPFAKISYEYEKTMGPNSIYTIQSDDDFFIDRNIIEEELTKFLVDTEGQDNALRIFSILKSLLPQKRVLNMQNISHYLNYSIYGILSYDGPVVAMCDFQAKQIVKGYFVRREDIKGREYRAIRIGEILAEVCPIDVTIYHDDHEIETKFEIKWMPYIGKPFIIGPCSLTVMITVLKQKDLVLNPVILENALISICRAFVEAGKAEFKDKKSETGYQMDLNKWLNG
jgi:hypothetical protein